MTFQLNVDETPTVGIKRIMFEELDAAIEELNHHPEGRLMAVHNARKICKRLRAVLRLVRDDIGFDTFRRENLFYRDVNRRIAPVRDSEVMITTLDAVTAHFAPQLPANAFAEVRRQLVNQHETISTRLLDDEQAMVEAAENLRTGRTRVADLSINHKDFSAFGPGLYRVYRRGRRCMTAAYNQGDPALFHEWRKQVKYLWHQVEILQPLWPTMLESLALDLHQLSDYLGQTHDLAVLRQTLHALPEPFNHNVDRAELATLIDQWQVEFETAAQPLGAQIYAEKPGRFVERMATYWAIWQSL